MPIEFTTLQRETLTAIVDTFVASVPRDDDPDGFYAAKGSDVGADVATEQYLLTHLPESQLAGLLQLMDAAGLFEFKDQPQAAREEILANVAAISPEAAGAIAALNQLSVLFAYSLPGPQGRNPLWVGMGYPGPAQNPPSDCRKTLEVITVSGETTLEADVVVVGSGSGGGVAAAALAEAGKRVIILEAGSYYNESDFVQSEVAAYQNLFLRGGFFPSADGMVSIAAGSTVGGGSTVNWSNSLLTPNTVRAHWAEAGLTDVDTPAFDEHLQAVFERIQCNDKVATQNGPHERLSEGASKLGHSYRVATLNIDPERYDPNLDRLQRDGRSDRRQAGHHADLPSGRFRRRSETAAQRLGRPDPHRQRRGRRGRGDIHRPTDAADFPRRHPRTVCRGRRGQPGDPWATPSFGYRWARRRRRTATAPRQPRQRGLRRTAGPVVRARDGRSHERVRRSATRDSGTSSNASSTCQACSPLSSRGSMARSTKSSRASIGTGPTGCSSSRTVVPAASRSMRTVNPRSGIHSTTTSIVVISAKPR